MYRTLADDQKPYCIYNKKIGETTRCRNRKDTTSDIIITQYIPNQNFKKINMQKVMMFISRTKKLYNMYIIGIVNVIYTCN